MTRQRLDTPDDAAFALLARANPVPDHLDLVDTGSYAPANSTLALVLAGAKSPVRVRATRQRRRRVIAVALVLGATASIAAAWALTRRADVPTAVSCFGQPSTDGVTVGTSPTGTALDTCAALWRNGILGRGEPPALVGCRLANGTAGVFPSASPTLCDELGLARLDLEQDLEREPAARLQAALVNYVGSSGECLTLDTVAAAARAQIESLGLSGWTVETPDELTEQRPCASFGVNSRTKTVIVVPGPRRAGTAPPTTGR